jgi:Tat protein translocase TatB subunit
MFNVGGGELIVILLIALIVLGPQRLPDAARQLGKAMGDLRRLSSGFQNEVKQAFDTADDPKRVTARRDVLGAGVPSDDTGADTDPIAPSDPAAADAAASDSIAAVSAQPSAPGKQTPPASQERAATKRVGGTAEPEEPSSVAEPPAPPSTA